MNVKQVGRVLAVVYGALGVVISLYMAATGAQRIWFPLGFFAVPFFLTINFNIAVPANLSGQVLVYLAMMLCFALTGWISGMVLAAVFNFVAKRMGGIDASFVETGKPVPSNPADQHSATPETF